MDQPDGTPEAPSATSDAERRPTAEAVEELLDTIPQAHERAELGPRQAAEGDTVELDQF